MLKMSAVKVLVGLILLSSLKHLNIYGQVLREPKIIRDTTPASFGNRVVMLPGYSDTWTNRQDLCNSLAKILQGIQYQKISVLVDDTRISHNNAEKCMEFILSQKFQNVEYQLIKYNSTGSTGVLASSISQKATFKNLLRYRQSVITPRNYDLEIKNGSALFRSILEAAVSLRQGDNLLVFADRSVLDNDLSQLTHRELKTRKIKVFIVWENTQPWQNKDPFILNELAYYTGGYLFILQNKLVDFERKLASHLKSIDTTKPKSLVLYQTYLQGGKSFKIPIDTGVTGIHFSITDNTRTAMFTSMTGFKMDLFDEIDVGHFSEGSFLAKIGNMYEVHLNTESMRSESIAGMWRLDVGDASAHDYNVTVSLQNNLKISSYPGASAKDKGLNNSRNKIRFGIQGQFQSIDNVSLENFKGETLKYPVAYRLREPDNSEKPKDEVETLNEKELDVSLKMAPEGPFLIKINGIDHSGKPFVRMAYYTSNTKNFNLPPLTIEVGEGSELLLTPTRGGSLVFDVISNYDQAIFVNFACRDQKSLLASMEPRWAWLSPKQRVSVTVRVYTQPWAGQNYENLITFYARGPIGAEKAVWLFVDNQQKVDNESPHMWHKYTSDCTNIIVGKCEEATWTIEVTAQDKETGLLQLSASGLSLYFKNPFISGTKDEVVGHYSGTCCDPTLQLTAIDLNHNRRAYVADAYRAKLSAGVISAIVLGIILFVLIIVAIVVIIKCRKKESGSMDIPTYRGPSGRY